LPIGTHWSPNRLDTAEKPVTATTHGLDELRALRIIAEGETQIVDILFD
jgi:hypothetical protein